MSKLKLTCWLLVLVLLASGAAAVAWKAGLFGATYTATASLQVARCEPRILSRDAKTFDPVEFKIYCDTQRSLIKNRFVILAALRDPKLKNRPCVISEDARHNTIAWLTDEIHVDFPDKNTGIMRVSASEPNAEDAAAIVNAVVEAYMNEVVNHDRQERRDHLSELGQIFAEKEGEVRLKREQLKRELENIGAGDDETMKARGAMAVSIYAQFLAEYQRMRTENRQLSGRLKEAKKTLADLPTAEIAETEIVMLLNNNPSYYDLQRRRVLLELTWRHIAALEMKQRPGVAGTPVELDPTKKQPDSAEQKPARQVLPDKSQPALVPTAPVPMKEPPAGLLGPIDLKQEQLDSVEQKPIGQVLPDKSQPALVPTVPVPTKESLAGPFELMMNPTQEQPDSAGQKPARQVLPDKSQPVLVPTVPVPDLDSQRMKKPLAGSLEQYVVPLIPELAPVPKLDFDTMDKLLDALEQKATGDSLRDKMKHLPQGDLIAADLEATRQQIESLEQEAVEQIRSAKRIALKQEIDRLENQAEISAEQLVQFEKEVERKQNEADSVGRSSVAAQMARAEVENIERVLRDVAEERERLRVELKSPPRIKVLGDPNAPAAVPESPD